MPNYCGGAGENAQSPQGEDDVSGSSTTSRRRRRSNGENVAESVKFGPLATWIGFNLRMAQEATFQAFSRRSLEIGESPGRFATLMLIARNPGISQTELSFANGRDKSSLTPVVEDLVRRGLVARKRVDHDRRTYRLNVTAAGKRTLGNMTRCARAHERNLDRIIGRRNRARFLQLLKRIAAQID
jgi:DNA-binding MarR family transcriptional regulator